MLQSSAVILSGGKSSRMKRNKAFITVEDSPMIVKLVERLRLVFPEVLIVTKDPALYAFLETKAKVVRDSLPYSTPLAGIHGGLKEAGYAYSFVVACDMPFVELKLAEHLVSLAPGYDVVVPRIGEHYEPLFAVYGKGCIPQIERCLAEGNHRILDLFPQAKVRIVEEESLKPYADLRKVFFNVNTPQDLAKAKEMLKDRGGHSC